MKGDKFLVTSHGVIHIERSDSGWSYCDRWNSKFNTDIPSYYQPVCDECLEKQEKDVQDGG